MPKSEIEEYKSYISLQLNRLSLIIQNYAKGNFSESISSTKKRHEFPEILEDLNIISEEIKEIIKERDSILSEYEKTKEETKNRNQIAPVLNARLQRDRQEFIGKQIEKALSESEKKFQSMIMNLIEGFYSVTLEGKLLIYNYEFTKILGLDPEKDYTGIDLPDFWQNPAKREDYINELLLSGFIRNYIIHAKKINGEKIILQANSRLIKDEEGKPVRIEGTILDITDKMKIEAELVNIDLTRKNEEMEQVLYATSHDLRSPLVNIQGFSRELQVSISELNSLLKNQDMPLKIWNKCRVLIEEDIPESLNYILLSSSKMDLLLSGLLSLSRIGRQKLKIKNLDMNWIINDVVSTYEYEIKEKNIKVDISQLPGCRGDELLINRLFSNLVGNAIKFIDVNRCALIQISGRMDKDHVFYFIKDNGIGIPPDQTNKIFQLFHQLDPNVAGTGLGLTIVKHILESHGGDIQVDSELGKGTCFTVSLPLISEKINGG